MIDSRVQALEDVAVGVRDAIEPLRDFLGEDRDWIDHTVQEVYVDGCGVAHQAERAVQEARRLEDRGLPAAGKGTSS